MELADPAVRPTQAVLPHVCVAVGGLSFGFVAWYLIVTHSGFSGGMVDLLFFACLALGTAGAGWLWEAYSRFFSRKTGVPLELARAYDAVSWGALVLFGSVFCPGRGECDEPDDRRRLIRLRGDQSRRRDPLRTRGARGGRDVLLNPHRA